MQKTWVDIDLAPGEPLHIIPYSDVHLDSRDCDREGWLKHYRKAAALPNARFISIGDMNNLVMSKDVKRHTPSAPREELAARDDYINAVLDDTEKAVRSVPGACWDLWGMGNHEYSVLKFHGFDLSRAMAERLKCAYGTYSGRLFYRIHRPGSRADNVCFKILYHHGAWGGSLIEGYGGAQRFAGPMGRWNVFLYGHNHAESVRKKPYWDVSDKGGDVTWTQYYVNTGAWLKSLSREGQPPDYAEVHGYPILAMDTPIIKVWYERVQTAGKQHGNQRMVLHYTVTA